MATRQQRADALEHANEVRMEVAALCAQIRAAGPRGGARKAAQIVIAGESRARFGRLVRAVPRVGERAARRMLRVADVDSMLRVCDVAIDRRRILAGELLRYAERSDA